MYIYVHIRTYRISRSKRTDDTSSIRWQAEKYFLKGFFEGWILVLRNFQDQEKMEEAETVHRQALQVGKQRPFSGESVWYVYGSLVHHTFAVFVFNIFFNILQKPSATPMGDVPRRLNECQVVTSRQTYSISIKITWQEREKQLCSTHPWTLLCYSRLAHVLQLSGKIHEAPEKLPGILGVWIWCVACTCFPASKKIE